MSKKIAIFGTSGFSYEVADVAYAAGYDDVILMTDSKVDVKNDDNAIKIVSEDKVYELQKQGYKFAIGVAFLNTKKQIHNKFKNLSFPNVIHPSAIFGKGQLENVNKTQGNIITAGVVMTNNILMGNFGVFNLNSTVGHDCQIGHYVSIMPGVNVSGNVSIGDGAWLGVSAIILQGLPEKKLVIGKGAIVGAGALVTKNVDEYITVCGIPARPLISN